MSGSVDLLAHLEAFVATAEQGSFTAAAEHLRIAQPLLSRRIKVLEEHFGGALFDRSRRQITSTDLGVLLLPHARDLLGRADHLNRVARGARAAAVHVIGVPPDCDPAALARLIRAGADRGVPVGVRELPAEERAAALAAGSLAGALLRVPPETARMVVPLGLAASAAPAPAGRPVHLDALRPRRGEPGETPPILVTAEDAAGSGAERFRRAVARAGLPDASERPATSPSAAVAETLAGHTLLLCGASLARRHDLPWAPLADAALHRGYDPSGAVPDWMEPMLAAVVGAAGAAGSRSAGAPDPRARLAARG